MALVLTAAVFFVLSIFRPSNDQGIIYTVTPQQWQDALGDEAHIQTIYRNVTVEIYQNETQEKMILATVNGGLILDNPAQDMKLICVPFEGSFVSYIYQYSSEKWEKFDGKADGVDLFLNSYLPGYVDTAMAGLKDEFEKAQYDSNERCYIITLQKPASSSDGSTGMHCRVYFENGQLSRLETEITSQNTTQTLKLYNIGKTEVEVPAVD